MQLSIIIVSYNTKNITKNCLSSIRNSSIQLEYEIILVDNASNDDSVNMVQEQFPEVRLIANDRNNMFAMANNQGMAIAKGNYILLLNSDTLIAPGNVENLYEFIDSHQPKVGCVGPRVLNSDRTLQSAGFPLPSLRTAICTVAGPLIRLLPVGFRKVLATKGHSIYPVENGNREVGWVHGSCFMFPSALAKEIGGLDVDFGFYGEEVDFCFQIQKRNLSTWLVDTAEVIHLGGGSSSGISEWSKKMLTNSRGYFYRKHFGIIRASFCILTYIIGFGLMSWLARNVQDRKRYRAGMEHYLEILKVYNEST